MSNKGARRRIIRLAYERHNQLLEGSEMFRLCLCVADSIGPMTCKVPNRENLFTSTFVHKSVSVFNTDTVL